MKNLHIDLTNCHGIHRLEKSISFERGNASAVYAPNGMMKTSLARTFADLAKGEPSADHLFPDRTSMRSITDENGADVVPDQVVVIVSYDEEMGPTEETSTLLVDKVLRDEYEVLQRGIYEAKAELVAALKVQAQTRKDVASAVSLAFMRDDESFFTALLRIEEELADDSATYAEVPFDTVFDDKVVALLRTKEFREALTDYVTRYNELLDESRFFNRETFSYYHASTITKSLDDNGFFAANHAVLLNSGDGTEQVSSPAELIALIDGEKLRISEDAELRKVFAVIEKQLTRNAECRRFYSYISAPEHLWLLPELENIDRFNERVWKSYLKVNENLYQEAVSRYRNAEKRKREIQTTAAKQRGQWEQVIDIFNDRFFVPFTLTAVNRTNVVLGLEPVAKLGFEFNDGAEHVSVERGELLEVLSTGEKKALYILNVLFEVERRKNSAGETLFIVDDIADSFDYKNKYAIIQYLKEMSEEANFRLVVLTHNFDFYRTLESRFVPYSQCLMAHRTDDGVTLVPAAGIKNPFIKDFKPNFFTDPIKRVAAIPFMRNLLEYTRGEDDSDYVKLTSLLHWKLETAAICQSELDQIFNDLFGTTGAWEQPDMTVVSMIDEQADECLSADSSINFANKIVMSIAIRLAAERHMVNEIGDDAFAAAIAANQTTRLFSRFKRGFADRVDTIRTLDSVVLMTPEHIHVNSFMYEPILDMSDDHLRRLLNEVRRLTTADLSQAPSVVSA